MTAIKDDDLVKRDMERNIWQETLDAVRDIKKGKIGAVHCIKDSEDGTLPRNNLALLEFPVEKC